MGFSEKVKLSNVAGEVINPSTSNNQSLIIQELQKKPNLTDTPVNDLLVLFKLLLQAVQNPPWLDKSANAIRNQVQSGTVTTVTNLTNFGSMSADISFRLNSQNTWANTQRRTLS